MKAVLLDTDIVSFFLRGHPQVVAQVQSYLSHFDALSFSILTHYEILSGLMHRDAQRQMSVFLAFAKECEILPLTERSVTISSELYGSLRRLGTPVDDIDLLIAGVALAEGLALVTHNSSHFERIPTLEVIDWSQSLSE